MSSQSARHLLHVFPSFGVGGVPIRMARIINSLGRRYRHTIVALDTVISARDWLDANVAVDVLPLAVNKKRPIRNFLAYHQMLKRSHPDLLITYNWGAIEWAMANRVLPVTRHIHHEAGFSVEEANAQIARRVLFRRLALSSAEKIIVPSRTLAEIATTAWRIAGERLVHIPNGIDLSRFSTTAGENPSLFTRREGELIIGTIAPLRPEKNLARLLRVFARMTTKVNARLLVAGDGSERGRLEALASDLKIADRVLFIGTISRPEVLLPSIDLFAISSETEQMPNSILEAMAAVLPIVGVDVGDIKHMVAPENAGFLVPRDDEAAFAEKALVLLSNAELRRRLGALNRDNVAHRYTQEGMIAAYDKVFSSPS
jgi:glycosyltransferase involved in cell wall biosynthesis